MQKTTTYCDNCNAIIDSDDFALRRTVKMNDKEVSFIAGLEGEYCQACILAAAEIVVEQVEQEKYDKPKIKEFGEE